MNICNIVLIIIIVILVFFILKNKSRENFETTDFEIYAERAEDNYTAAENIKKWYKIDTQSWRYNPNQPVKDLGYSYKFKKGSALNIKELLMIIILFPF